MFTQLPMFQRQGPAAYKANLNATLQICDVLDHPEDKLKFVHVAGTNGKGTVCHMIAAALQLSGHKVGLFTSPHLVDFRERIRINGECISEESVVKFVECWQESQARWGTPSFFELTFGMALDHFARESCDIVVLETGMGGRLDSTNIVANPEVTAVTNIGLDHQAFLGPDIRSIAKEKAGIFKAGIPVVLGPMRPEAQSELLAAALKTSSEVHYARDAEPEIQKDIASQGNFIMRKNLSTAWTALQVLKSRGWDLSAEAIHRGLLEYAELTGQRGRWECVEIPGQPLVVLDGAHNMDGVTLTMNELESLVSERDGALWIIWGTVADKDQGSVMASLPSSGRYFWSAADIPRAMPADEVAKIRPELEGVVISDPTEALSKAMELACQEDVIFVGGSLFVVGDVLRAAPLKIPTWPASQ